MVRPHQRVKVKICGITTLEDARRAVSAGCDALGFVFYEKSPRYLKPQRAHAIIARLPKRIMTVGVFVNAREEKIRRIVTISGIKALQLHGRETPVFCRRFKHSFVIKAFRIRKKFPWSRISQYRVSAYLFDAFHPSRHGGTGRSFDWRTLSTRRGNGPPVFLSGGLTPGNVRAAIRTARPDWVDVSSGVECSPGVKDPAKVRNFINTAKRGVR